MICANCGSHRVEWKGPLSDLTHTECADCGGINCQTVEGCTCMEVFGEDPECALHGLETEWGKANPEEPRI